MFESSGRFCFADKAAGILLLRAQDDAELGVFAMRANVLFHLINDASHEAFIQVLVVKSRFPWRMTTVFTVQRAVWAVYSCTKAQL